MRIWNLPIVDLASLSDLTESRPVAVVTSGPAWRAVEDRLHLPIGWRAEVREATLAAWDALSRDLQQAVEAEQVAVLYAVGGGLPADAAKYLASQVGLPLICLPTALSVDAFFTWASGFRSDGCVCYIETRPPDRLIVDLDVIAAGPPAVRAAGITDVLSIATGLWDWRFAEEQGRNPPGMAYVEWAAEVARAILSGALDCPEAAGAGDRAGLKRLLDCLALEAQLCNQLGHARPEEGSEHYFAYAVENAVGPGLPHGELVGPGIVIMAGLQGQDVAPLRRALESCHVPLDRIPPAVVESTLSTLAAYSEKHALPYGIAHTL